MSFNESTTTSNTPPPTLQLQQTPPQLWTPAVWINMLPPNLFFGNNVSNSPLAVWNAVPNSAGQVFQLPTTNKQVVHKCEWKDCGLQFPTIEALVEHVQLTHVQTPEQKKEPWCRWADCERNKKLESRYALKVHLQRHTGEKPYKCDYPGCNKKYSGKEGLLIHREIHSNAEQYTCNLPGCMKKFVSALDCERHQARHTAQRYSCPLQMCLRTYTSSRSLRFHMKKAHGEDEYEAARRSGYFRSMSLDNDALVNQPPQLPRVAKGFTIADILADQQGPTVEHAALDEIGGVGAGNNQM